MSSTGPISTCWGSGSRRFTARTPSADVERSCRELCKAAGVELEFSQTNSEAELIGRIQAARSSAGIVINPAGCSYSVPVLDALKACAAPIVEVHISNIHARSEAWRAETLTTAAAVGVISGLGVEGYALALQFLLKDPSFRKR